MKKQKVRAIKRFANGLRIYKKFVFKIIEIQIIQ